MIAKQPLCPDRRRTITRSFAFIEHRCLRDGFWSSLSQLECLLYVFLVLVADRNGLSYYSYDKICTLLRFTLEDYLVARNGQPFQYDHLCARSLAVEMCLPF